MLNNIKKAIAQNKIAVGVTSLIATTASQAAVTMPTPDYTSIESAATVGFGIVLTVGLLMQARRFFR